MTANVSLHIKEGETLIFDCMIYDGIISVLDLTNFEITAEIRRLSGELLKEIRIVVLNAELARFRGYVDGTPIPVGTYFVDIKFKEIPNNLTILTEDFELVVKPSITKGTI